MTQSCEHLEPLLNVALSMGAKIQSIDDGWSEAKRVVTFSSSMPEKLKEYLDSNDVEYYCYAGSPHNPPDEGLFCTSCKVGLSFPKKVRAK